MAGCGCHLLNVLTVFPQGFEIGSGFDGSQQLGSQHNDEFFMEGGQVRTRTNRWVSLHRQC